MGFYFIKGVTWKGAEMIRLLLSQTLVQSCANEQLKRFRGDSFFRSHMGHTLFEKGSFFKSNHGPVRKSSHGRKSLPESKKENPINFMQEG